MLNNFEAEKNTKAFSYTVMICCSLLLLFVFYKWPLQIPKVPAVQDLIEVNLGNENEGLGNIQPLVKGAPAKEHIIVHNNAGGRTAPPTKETIKADEDNNQEAAVINKQANNKKITRSVDPPQPNKKIIPKASVINKTPAPPKLKIPLYKGANGSGGNGALTDNGYRNEGYKNGNGDAGSPGGKADSYGNAPGGRSGVSVIRGLSGRRPIHFPTMQDEFNENAKIYVDISVNASGSVTDASVARGSTSSNSSLINIALQKAKQLKFPPASAETERGTILFNFILKN